MFFSVALILFCVIVIQKMPKLSSFLTLKTRVFLWVCGRLKSFLLLMYVRTSKRAVVGRSHLTPEVCCSQESLTFWYTLQHPWGLKTETRAPGSSCPINRHRIPGTTGQRAAAAWVSITGFDRSSAPLAALLHCPSGQSAPQLALRWWVMPAPSVACQREPGATEEVQISSNGLDPDGCVDDNRPRAWGLGFFCQGETRRGHHNNTAKLCMQDKHYWHVKEHSQLLW